MKLKKDPVQPVKPKPSFKQIYGSPVLQVFLLLVAFFAGAFVYRAGALTPVSSFVRQVLSGRGIQLPGPLAEVQQNVIDELRLYEENGLQTLFIDLQFEHYQKMLDKRAEALDIGILQTTDEDFSPVRVQLKDGPRLDAEIRLKGDWTDHLVGDKWSFRVKLESEGQILRFRQFSLQAPETRNFLNEWAFHQNLMEEGILATRYDFVNVLLNGRLLGIYAIEEHFAPQLIESQGRRAGVIIRFDEDLYWENIANFWQDGITVDGGSWMTTNESSADITTFQGNKVALDPVLKAEADTARALLRAYQTGKRPASEVFDVERMGRYFALTDLWQACHGVYWHNWRFYYNPVTGLLEPVAFDNEPFQWCRQEASISSEFIEMSNLFNDPEIRAAYVHELDRITQPGYVDRLQDQLGTQSAELEAALRVEYPDGTLTVGVNWGTLRARQHSLAQELQPSNPVKGSFQASGVMVGDTSEPSLQIELTNLMILPVEVVRVELNGVPLPFPADTDLTLPPVIDPKESVFHPVHVTLPLTDTSPWQQASPPQVDAIVRLAGLTTELRAPLVGAATPDELLIGPLPASSSLEELLEKYSFLSASPDGKSLLAAPGIWDVRADLALPDGVSLHVSAGTVLRFEPGAVLLARSTVDLMGTASEPVILTAQDEQQGWGGIVVLNAEAESLWTYAKVERTFGIARGGWILTGGITFFNSSIRLEHSRLGNNQTEDAINVIHGKFAFINSEFLNTFADAFDGDFAQGEITDCYFHDIAGDAVDVSGANVTVRDTRMERIGDKGVSVGEESVMNIENVTMDTVGIGVASKDLSTTTVNNSTITKARFSALAAYIKKPVFGPASIEATDLVILETETPAIAQVGSTILLNNEHIETVELDVEALYEQGILGN